MADRIPAGLCRGYPTEFDPELGVHVFADTGLPTPLDGGEERPCPFCGRVAAGPVAPPDHEGGSRGLAPDPCLGSLPGVKSACCGHGVSQGWVSLEAGPMLAVHVDYPGCWGCTGRPSGAH